MGSGVKRAAMNMLTGLALAGSVGCAPLNPPLKGTPCTTQQQAVLDGTIDFANTHLRKNLADAAEGLLRDPEENFAEPTASVDEILDVMNGAVIECGEPNDSSDRDAEASIHWRVDGTPVIRFDVTSSDFETLVANADIQSGSTFEEVVDAGYDYERCGERGWGNSACYSQDSLEVAEKFSPVAGGVIHESAHGAGEPVDPNLHDVRMSDENGELDPVWLWDKAATEETRSILLRTPKD